MKKDKNMPTVLHIDSSPRGERSHSRTVSAELVAAIAAAHPDTTVTYRDLGHNPPPHVTEAWIAGAYSPPEAQTAETRAALAISDELIAELKAADILVFGVPMYNFNVPSTFKAYIDNIVRVGVTFGRDYSGLVTGKKAFVVTARGAAGYGAGEAMGAMNHQDPFLRTVFGFIGITDVTFIHLNNLNGKDEVRAASLEAAHDEIKAAVASL